LVNGARHEGSCWNQVIKRPESPGHIAFAPTASHGRGVDKQVSHAQWTRSVVDFIVDNDLTDIAPIGLSFGGTIISKARRCHGQARQGCAAHFQPATFMHPSSTPNLVDWWGDLSSAPRSRVCQRDAMESH